MRRRVRTPSQRADARAQLPEVEGLGEVVVRPEVEPLDAIVHGGGGGQHQDAAIALRGDQLAADIVAVEAGKVAVEHDDVVGVDRRLLQRGSAVESDIDGEPVAAQAPRDRVREVALVLHQQHAHRGDSFGPPASRRLPLRP